MGRLCEYSQDTGIWEQLLRPTRICASEVAARSAAAAAAEAAIGKKVCAQLRFPSALRANVAVTVQAALLYAAGTWHALSPPQRRKMHTRYVSPLRRAVDGAWSHAPLTIPMSANAAVL